MNYPRLKDYVMSNYPKKAGELIEYLDSLEFEADVNRLLQDQYKVNEVISEDFAATCLLDRRADEYSE